MKILYHPKRILGFEPYVAPDDFDRKAQPVDIYDVFERYYKNHRTAKWIYSLNDIITTHFPINGTSYRYGYTSGGVNHVFDISATTLRIALTATNYTSIPVNSVSGFPTSGTIRVGTNNFIYTSVISTSGNESFEGASQLMSATTINSQINPIIDFTGTTKRWIISNSTAIGLMDCVVNQSSTSSNQGMEWLYLGDKVRSVHFSYNSTLKYIHIHDLSNITTYPVGCGQYSGITGTMYVSDSVTEFGRTTAYFSGYTRCDNLTKVIFSDSVQKIGQFAFGTAQTNNGCKNLTTVVFGSGLTHITRCAFAECKKLENITIPDTVTFIGSQAFWLDEKLTGTLIIPASVNTIEFGAFQGCEYSAITVNPANTNFISDKSGGDTDILYDKTGGTKMEALYSAKYGVGSLILRNDTTQIIDYCSWSNQTKTGTLTVPDSVTRVGVYAFYDCDGFTEISLETTTSALATIDDYAFSHCSNLAGTLTLPNSVTLVDAGAFQDDVLISAIVFGSGLVTIGANAFRQMTAISENLVIPNSVETIGATAFYNNTARTGTLTLGTGLKTIGGSAFGNTPLTGTLSIPSLVTAIGEAAFSNNNFSAVSSAATGFTVSDYVLYDETTSGQINAHTSARGYAGALTLKTGITSILYLCFYNNDNRSGAIVIPYTVTLIRQQAFDDCSGFNSTATIGDTTNGSALASIEAYAFRGCANITGWNIYRTPAPTCNNSFSGYAKPLHIKVGATGYDVTPATAAAPWTNTAIFSSVTADL